MEVVLEDRGRDEFEQLCSSMETDEEVAKAIEALTDSDLRNEEGRAYKLWSDGRLADYPVKGAVITRNAVIEKAISYVNDRSEHCEYYLSWGCEEVQVH